MIERCAGGIKLLPGKPCPECGAGPQEQCPKLIPQLREEIERLQAHTEARAQDIITLGQEVGRLRTALLEIDALTPAYFGHRIEAADYIGAASRIAREVLATEHV